MVQEKIIRSIIAPVVVAGILILAVLTAIPSNALTTHSSSEYEKCVKSSNNCFLLNNESSTSGNGAKSQESSNIGNAQESSNTGNAQHESSNTGNAQESSNTGTCNKIFCENPPQKQETSNTGNAQESSNTGSSQQGSSNTGNAAQGASNTENTGQRADLAKTILDEHNRERSAVSVPALVWSNKLAADATAWAEHLAQTLRGVEQLKPEHHAKGISEGENIAQRSDSRGPSAIPTDDLVKGWISEKNGYNHAPFDFKRDYAHAHYTQMVWRTTTAVGCGTANAGDSVYLVCRYSPPGNYDGQNPY